MRGPRLVLTVSMVLPMLFATAGYAATTGSSHGGDSHGKSSYKKGGHKKSGGHGAHVHWGYQGSEGPGRWGDLSDAYEMCKDGYNQSPIDISTSSPYEMDGLKFHYDSVGLNMINNGHTVQVNYDGSSLLEVAGNNYSLAQFHFHSPSEHMIDGRHAPMEVHFVHKSDSGRLAVVGVMVRKGRHNPALEAFWKHMPEASGGTYRNRAISVDAADILPASRDYFHYNGSLTTPPCSEGVRWFVLKKPIEASEAQISKFLRVVGENARPVQPLNVRLVRNTD